MREGGPPWTGREVLCLLSLMLVAVAVRALGFEFVFVDGDVYFPVADPQYHVRLAWYGFVHFPKALLFDPYLAFPDGAPVPWPPLFDLMAGGLARLLARDRHGFEVVMAWLGPLTAALALVPIHLLGRRLDSPRLGALAGLFFVLLPASFSVSQVGHADHHAWVAMLGAWLLYACTRAVDAAASRAGAAGAVGLGVAARVAIVSSWNGSLLYLALAEASLLLAGLAARDTRLLRIQVVTALAACVCLLPLVVGLPTPYGGPFSTVSLSWLHPIALLPVAVGAGSLVVLGRVRPAAGTLGRLGVLLLSVLVFLVLLALLPQVRAGLGPALAFLTLDDPTGRLTLEQRPLFPLFGRPGAYPAQLLWGAYAWLIPLAPAAALGLRAFRAGGGGRMLACMLLGWGLLLGGLTLWQVRFGNEFAPTAALLFAAALLTIARALAGLLGRGESHPRLTLGLAVALCVALFAVPIRDSYGPRARSSLAALGGRPDPLAHTSGVATVNRFAERVRQLTPETSGYLDREAAPEYAVIAHPTLGHVIRNVSRRPATAGPFWSYVGRESWRLSVEFLGETRESEALERARRLRARYVITTTLEAPGSVAGRLHRSDGVASGRGPRLEHFRLVAEAASGGRSLVREARPRDAGQVPYKLFEIVPGAELEVRTVAGHEVTASLALRTAQGRAFTYVATARADAAGLARLTLPYASELAAGQAGGVASRRGVVPTGPYRVAVDGRVTEVAVPDDAVRSGARIALPPDGAEREAS